MRWAAVLLFILLMSGALWAAPTDQVTESAAEWVIPALSMSIAKTTVTRVDAAPGNPTREMPEYFVFCSKRPGRCDVVITAWHGADAEARHHQFCGVERHSYTLGQERVAVGGRVGQLYIGAHGPQARRAFISVVAGGWWLRFSINRPTAEFDATLKRLRQVVAVVRFY